MKIGSQIITCAYDATIYDASVSPVVNPIRTFTEEGGYAAVALTAADSTGAPVPSVKLAATGEKIYGALISVNTATQRCGVATGGVIPFRKNAVTDSTDLSAVNRGVIPSSTAGQVIIGAADGAGRGTVVARGGDSSTALFVDLDVDVKA